MMRQLATNETVDLMAVPEGVDESAALIIAIVQTIFLVLMGPTVLFYGPAVHKSVIFVQALFAANYVAFVGAFAAVDAFTAFDVWDRFVVLCTATLTLTFTAIKSQQARAASQGAVLGVLIATPLTQFMRDTLFINWVGCTGYGVKGGAFPDGKPTVRCCASVGSPKCCACALCGPSPSANACTPKLTRPTSAGVCCACSCQGCDLHSVEFQVAFQLSKVLFWIITAGMAYIGKKVRDAPRCDRRGTALLSQRSFPSVLLRLARTDNRPRSLLPLVR